MTASTKMDCCEKMLRLVQLADRDMQSCAAAYRRRETPKIINNLIAARAEYDKQRDEYKRHLKACEGEK